MSRTVAPRRSSGMALAICFHLTLGKSPRKWWGAVGTPCRVRLWNHSPSSEIRRVRCSRAVSPTPSVAEGTCGETDSLTSEIEDMDFTSRNASQRCAFPELRCVLVLARCGPALWLVLPGQALRPRVELGSVGRVDHPTSPV